MTVPVLFRNSNVCFDVASSARDILANVLYIISANGITTVLHPRKHEMNCARLSTGDLIIRLYRGKIRIDIYRVYEFGTAHVYSADYVNVNEIVKRLWGVARDVQLKELENLLSIYS